MIKELQKYSIETLSDAMDTLKIKGVIKDFKTIGKVNKAVGKAFTVKFCKDIDSQKCIAANYIDNVKSENIIIIDNDDISECTVWGNILTQTAIKKKIQGTIINGASRDFSFNRKTKYPLFSRSINCKTGKGIVRLEYVQKEITIQSLCDQYVNMYRWFLNHIAVNHIPMIVYFQKIDLKILNSEIDKNFVESVAKENWDGRNLSEMTGIESVTLGIIVAIGIGLGLTILLPTIRSMIYYWGCLKVSLSNFYSDESIYLAFNVKRLKEELSRETDPKKRERLELIIEKQEKEIAKLEEKAYKLSIQFEENASQVEKNMEADTEVEDNEYFESYQPQVLI